MPESYRNQPFKLDEQPAQPTGSDNPAKRRKLAIVLEKLSSQRWIVEYLRANNLHAWLDGDTNLTITLEQINRVLTHIANSFSGRARRYAHNFFVSGLDLGRQVLGWEVEPPNKIIQLFTRPPAFSENEFQLDKTACQLREDFLKRWAHPSSPERVLPGDIIFASIMFAGIINTEVAVGFCKHCVERLRYHDGFAWVAWETEVDRWERVVLDPVTTGLLIRWMSENPACSSLFPEASTGSMLKALEMVTQTKRLGITSIKRFIEYARSYWAYESPAVIYYLARRTLRAARLSESSFYRLLTGKREPLRHYEQLSEPQQNEKPHEKGKQIVSSERALGELNHIRKIQRAMPWKKQGITTNHAVAQKLAQIETTLPPQSLAWYLQQWSTWILQKAGRSDGALTYGSLREYMTSISGSLAAHLDGRSPLEVRDEWPTLIDYLIENAELVRHKKMIPALSSLCVYLQKEHAFPMPDLKSIHAERSVNAVLITEDEYQLIFSSLQPDSMLQVALMLGYRLGLRISEVAGLEMREILQHSNPTLYVFNNEHRPLKSQCSRRVLQLGDLCLPNELELLDRYLEQRLKAINHSTSDPLHSPLLPRPGSNKPIETNKLQQPIHEAIWKVTGCRNISFHGLRHSLVNRALIATMEELYGCRRSILDMKANEGTAPKIDYPLATTNNTRPIRPRLWGIAKQLGHLSPETTIGSYFHLPEWAIFLRADSLCKDIPHTVFAGIAGVTVNNYNVTRARNPSVNCMVSLLLLKKYKTLAETLTPDFSLAERPCLKQVLYSEQPLQLIKDLSPFKAAIERMCKPKNSRVSSKPIENLTEKDMPWSPPAFSFDERLLSPDAKLLFDRVRQFRYCKLMKPINNIGPIKFGRMTINIKLELPGVPRAATERLQVNNLAIALRELSKSDPRKFTFFVVHSLSHLEHMPNAARFTAIDDSFCSWLETLGSLVKSANQGLIREDEHYMHIEFYHVPATKSDLAEHEQKAAWVNKIGGDCELKKDPSFNFSPKRRIWRNGSLYICIKAPESADSNATNWGRIGSSALYTACYYAALTEPQTLP